MSLQGAARILLLTIIFTLNTYNVVIHAQEQTSTTLTPASASTEVGLNSTKVYDTPNKRSLEDLFINTECNFPNPEEPDLFQCVKKINSDSRQTVLITGGAGFVGSHLTDSIMLDGHKVTVFDNLSTGRLTNLRHWIGHPNFIFIEHDIENPLPDLVDLNFTQIYHLASPASPKHYMSDPIKTIRTITIGTGNILELAERAQARIVIASTSEVYGDPEVHPQHESYWGNTNPIGPRSCYDEGKRLAESLATAYATKRNVSVAIARIFNTFGPRMHPNDGRVVSNFIIQALTNKSLTVYGSGRQTRSFAYISDLISGLRNLMSHRDVGGPINLGNPDEITIQELAIKIKNRIIDSNSNISYTSLPLDDPHKRRPDICRARQLLDWNPAVKLTDGLDMTIKYFSHSPH